MAIVPAVPLIENLLQIFVQGMLAGVLAILLFARSVMLRYRQALGDEIGRQYAAMRVGERHAFRGQWRRIREHCFKRIRDGEHDQELERLFVVTIDVMESSAATSVGSRSWHRAASSTRLDTSGRTAGS